MSYPHFCHRTLKFREFRCFHPTAWLEHGKDVSGTHSCLTPQEGRASDSGMRTMNSYLPSLPDPRQCLALASTQEMLFPSKQLLLAALPLSALGFLRSHLTPWSLHVSGCWCRSAVGTAGSGHRAHSLPVTPWKLPDALM